MKSFYWTILRYGNITWGSLNGSNCPEDIRTLDACASNNGVAKHMKPKKLIELNGEIQKCTITIRGCNTHFLAIARTAAQKKNQKGYRIVQQYIKQQDTIESYTTLYPTPEYTYFPRAHCTYTMVDHILGQKPSLNKCKIIEIT